jgi:hypothetical protein
MSGRGQRVRLALAGGVFYVGVPMLPVARGECETSRQILLYSVALVAVTVTPATTRFCTSPSSSRRSLSTRSSKRQRLAAGLFSRSG